MIATPLSELVEALESGARPKGGIQDGLGEIPSLGAEHLSDDGGFNFDKDKRIPYDFFCSMTKGRIQENDILLVKDGATTGKVSFVNKSFPYREAAINEHVFRIKISPHKASSKFVFWFLQSAQGRQQVMSDFRGATVGGIGRTFLDKVFVPAFTLDEQRRIAAILDKADAIRRKRQQALALADDFLRSAFLEMFGDPVTNPKGWPEVALGDVLNGIDSGFSPKCQDRPANDGEWGILKLSAITSTKFDSRQNKAIIKFDDVDPRHEVRPGDLLFTRKNTYELVGASALVGDCQNRLLLPDLIFRLVTNQKVNKKFLWAQLTQPTMRKRIKGLANGAAGSMPNISKSRLIELPILLPDMAYQAKFARVYERMVNLKPVAEQSRLTANALFSSLSQRAFRGEL